MSTTEMDETITGPLGALLGTDEGAEVDGDNDGSSVGKVVEGAQDGTAVGARDETEMFSSVVAANTVLQSEVGVSSISSL